MILHTRFLKTCV